MIKKNDVIQVDYEGSFEDGTIFDTSSHGDHSHPLEFTVGAGEVIGGFDNAVIGMKVGEEKKISIVPEEAYGFHRKELIKEIAKSQLPDSEELKEGMEIALRAPDGSPIPVKVVAADDEKITLDFNHPLAGKTLFFKIKILKIIS